MPKMVVGFTSKWPTVVSTIDWKYRGGARRDDMMAYLCSGEGTGLDV